ncbi:DNA-binding transcriptional regulator, LysR family [Cryobacterium flavum]|uniref:DNA-binding transcriptional regulator, LysR family n=1 Tax=Cryobacterium flavum TaxID=1424659 RepID=A0A4R8VES3_9MICO|nr:MULTISPECIES: LysR family transcriptional regulator [Cryobacterium]TFB81036.1 LysR family transcriptional regulator [Cryobacterium flavum]SDM79542.1 DNA-binding transcriptional regulator, LysR family [Cryobacterium flavum]
MELRQLAVLRELGERGSVAAVARALHVSSSAVSQQLSALEQRAGVKLTEKHGRVLRLTPAGVALASAAADVSTAMARADEAVARFQNDPGLPVTVSAFHSAGLAWFGPLLNRMHLSGGPTVGCGDEDVPRERFAALVADYDLVIAHRVPHDPAWPNTVAVTPLLFEPLDVAVPVGHPLAEKVSLTLDDIRDEPWVTGHVGFPLAEAVNVVAAAAGQPLRIAHRINEFFVATSVVATGAAIALLPRYTMAPRQGDGVVLVPFRGLTVGRQIDVLSRPETLARASVRRVLAELVDVAGQR